MGRIGRGDDGMTRYLYAMTAMIAAVAVYDIYCTVALHDSILHCEENPLALWLIDRHDNILHTTHPSDPNKTLRVRFSTPDVSLLVGVKAAGLCCAVPGMIWLIDSAPRMARTVIIPIFCGSIWLLARLVH